MNILLVEDNPEYLDFLKEALVLNGYTVVTALDGVQAQQHLDRAEIDLIISDVKMPNCDGIEFHTLTRAHPKHRQTKFILISGYREAYEDQIRLNPALDFFLDKAMPVRDLLAFVDRLLLGNLAGMWV